MLFQNYIFRLKLEEKKNKSNNKILSTHWTLLKWIISVVILSINILISIIWFPVSGFRKSGFRFRIPVSGFHILHCWKEADCLPICTVTWKIVHRHNFFLVFRIYGLFYHIRMCKKWINWADSILLTPHNLQLKLFQKRWYLRLSWPSRTTDVHDTKLPFSTHLLQKFYYAYFLKYIVLLLRSVIFLLCQAMYQAVFPLSIQLRHFIVSPKWIN